MALEHWQFQDPARVLIRKQEIEARARAACGSCLHHQSLVIKGEVLHICEFKRRQYGRRCDLFETKKGNT